MKITSGSRCVLLVCVALFLALACGTGSEAEPDLAKQTRALGEQCAIIAAEYVDNDDGCDCPADGDTSCDPDCAEGNAGGEFCGCEFCHGDPPPPPPPGEQCAIVPPEFIDEDDGCDCPASGDTSCDPDCSHDNDGGGFCGCEYCHGDPPPPPPPGEQCEFVPAEYIDENDGCDCPASGDRSCDPDCADGNEGGEFCGCQFCYGELPPPPPPSPPPALPLTRPAIAPTALSASAAVGALRGSGSVGLDGQYRYQIPIDVPEGRAGMTPSLSLNYQSSGADNLVGVGWALSGFSSITRCSKIKAQGGTVERVLFVPSDAYCLDGQRLVLMSGSPGETGAVYRTEIDTGAQIRVTSHLADGPRTWVVNRADGRTAAYESNDVARYRYDDIGHRELLANVALSWSIVTEDDRSRNRIVYDYFGSNGVDYPSFIEYTTCTSLPCPAARVRRIDFRYEPRPDSSERFINGATQQLALRLKHVIASIKDDAGVPRTVSRYTLRYVPSAVSGRSLVDEIEVCDAADVCLPPTRFEWAGENTADAAYELLSQGTWSSYTDNLVSTFGDASGNVGESSMAVYDANGDGNDDVLLKRWPVTDENGNIALSSNPDSNSAEDLLLLADGGGFFFAPMSLDYDGDGITRLEAPCFGMEIMDPGSAIPVDLDGNGVLELVAHVNRSCPFANANGVPKRNAPGTIVTNAPGYGWAVIGWDDQAQTLRARSMPDIEALPYTAQLQFPEMNGDGLPELAWSDRNNFDETFHGWNVFRALTRVQDPTLPQVTYAAAAFATFLRGPPMDFLTNRPDVNIVVDEDGDGRQELLQTAKSSIQRVYRWSATGEAEFLLRDVDAATTTTTLPPATSPQEPSWTWGDFTSNGGERVGETSIWYRVDVNGDGLKDALYRVKTAPGLQWRIRNSTGNGFGPYIPAETGTTALTDYMSDETALAKIRGMENGMRFADMNGDGQEDIVLMGDPDAFQHEYSDSEYTASFNSIRVMYSTGSQFRAPVSLGITQCPHLFKQDQRWPMNAIGDIDGNGLPEVIELCGVQGSRQRRLQTYRMNRVATGFDVIVRVNDERLGPAQLITYDTLSDGSAQRFGDVHAASTHRPARARDCIYPAACTARGSVVRHFEDRRSARTIETSHKYAGARVDRQGRGWLGFARADIKDELSGRTSVYELDQEAVERLNGDVSIYPHAGSPVRLFVTLPSTQVDERFDLLAPVGGLSEESTVWGRQLQGSYPIRARLVVSETDVLAGDGLFYTYETREEFDPDYPFRTLQQLETTDHVTGATTTQRTTTTYQHDPAAWLIGRPSRTTSYRATSEDAYFEQCTSDVCSESTVTVDFNEYAPGTKLIKTATRTHGSETLVTRNTYDSNGLLTRRRLDAEGQTRDTDFAYDVSGSYVEGQKNAVGHQSWALRDSMKGRVYATVDPNGVQTLVHRDGFGRVVRVEGEDGSRVDHSYAVGRVDTIVQGGGTSSTRFDLRGRPERRDWSAFDGQTARANVHYNEFGLPRLVEYGTDEDYDQLESAVYDRLGRLVRGTNGSDEHTVYTYSNNLALSETTDPKGNRSQIWRNAQGSPFRMVRLSTAAGSVPSDVSYRYNELGQLSAVIPADLQSRVVERMHYDAVGRQTTWTSDGTLRLGMIYTPFGDAELMERDGLSIELEFDKLGRAVARTELGTGETQAYRWDGGTGGLGRLTTATGSAGHLSMFSYDALGRPTERREVFTSGESLSYGYTYDANGRLSELRYPEAPGGGDVFSHAGTGGLTIRHNYQNGQLASITEVGAGSPVLWRATSRHLLGMVTGQRDLAGVTTASTFHANTLRLQGKIVSGVTAGTPPNQSYSYEINGALQGRTIGNGAVHEVYTYNAFNQLSQHHLDGSFGNSDIQFGYRPSGDLATADWGTTHESYAYASADKNRLTRLDLGTNRLDYTYDDAGRVRTVSHPSGTSTVIDRVYEYNSFNLPSAITVGATAYTFKYDAFGQRVKKTRGDTARALYVGDLYEQRAIQGSVNESVFRLRTDEGIVGEVVKSWSGGTVIRRMFHTDQQGSAHGLTEGTVSTLTGGFSPFGRRRSAFVLPQTLSNYGFCGHVQDFDLSLINMKGRIYDPVQRRFLTRDAVLDNPYRGGGTSAYSYVRNDPTNLVDPTGFQSTESLPEIIIVGDQSIQLSQHMSQQMNGPSGISASMAQGRSDAMAAMQGAEISFSLGASIGAGMNDPNSGVAASMGMGRAGSGSEPRTGDGGAGALEAAGRAAGMGFEAAGFLSEMLRTQVPSEKPDFQLTFDAGTEGRIGTLRNDLQPLVRQHLETLRMAGVDGRVVQGTRTMAEQAALFAQGRTAPGNIVTKAPPGTSAHNFGAAYDLGIFVGGRYSGSSPIYGSVGPAAAPPGLVWGGSIPAISWDVGHYQLGPNWRALPGLQQQP